MDKGLDWDTTWAHTDFSPLVGTNLFTELLNVFVPDATPDSTALEIGCYPGKFIEYVGRKGYQISGIDTYPRVVELNELFHQRGLQVCSFTQTALNDFSGAYDLVISFGFIEHFVDWPSIFMRHLNCVKPGGRMIIGCPNFASPLQRAMHTAVDKSNIEQHVLSSMYPALWGPYLKLLEMEVVYADHIGPFLFWADTPCDPASNTYKLQQAFLSAGDWLAKIKGGFEAAESGYCLIVADKPCSWPANQDVANKICEDFLNLSQLLDAKDQQLCNGILNTFESIKLL